MTDLNWGWWLAPTFVTILSLYWFHHCTGRYIRGNNAARALDMAIDEAGAMGMFTAVAWIAWAVLA